MAIKRIGQEKLLIALLVLRVPLGNYDRPKQTMDWVVYKPAHKAIELRAYQIWQNSGGEALNNWLQAERELMIKAKIYLFTVIERPLTYEDAIEETIQVIIRGDISYYFPYLKAYLSGLKRTRRSL